MSKSKWEQFRATKFYDLLAASPLILWYSNGLRRQSPLLIQHFMELKAGTIHLSEFLQFAAILGSAAFSLALIYLLIVRVTPVARSKGFLPRFTAVVGTFVSTGFLYLPAAGMSVPMQALSNILIFGGFGASAYVLVRLGRAFAIMPEARQLVTSGPYATVRHPLYTVESVAVLGIALQFQQPWAFMLMLVNFLLLYARSVFEERVLEGEYPQYAAYRAATARFIPGIF